LNIRKGILLIACYLVALQQAEARAAIYSLHYHALLDARWIALIISCLFMLLLVISCGWLRLRGSLLIVQLGAMTYPLYLMHQNIGFMLMNHLYRHLEKHLLTLTGHHPHAEFGLCRASLDRAALCLQAENLFAAHPAAR